MILADMCCSECRIELAAAISCSRLEMKVLETRCLTLVQTHSSGLSCDEYGGRKKSLSLPSNCATRRSPLFARWIRCPYGNGAEPHHELALNQFSDLRQCPQDKRKLKLEGFFSRMISARHENCLSSNFGGRSDFGLVLSDSSPP